MYLQQEDATSVGTPVMIVRCSTQTHKATHRTCRTAGNHCVRDQGDIKHSCSIPPMSLQLQEVQNQVHQPKSLPDEEFLPMKSAIRDSSPPAQSEG